MAILKIIFRGTALPKPSLNMEQILPLIKNVFIPSALFGIALLCFFAYGQIAPASLTTLHCAFYIISFSSFMVLLYYNQSKPVFYILTFVLSYILINHLKNTLGADYATSSYYINLCFFIPLNLAIFYFIPNHRLLTRLNVYLLLGLFLQFSIGEFLGSSGFKINLNLLSGHLADISILSFVLFVVTLSLFFMKSAQKGYILDYALMFAGLNILMALLYSHSPTALTIFYSNAALTLLVAIIQDIYHNTYKDILTGLASRYAYMLNSEHFPLKYSIGLISIDDYEKLLKVFGRGDRDTLVRMIVSKISEEEGEENIYRYNEDEFVIIFKNEDKNECFEHLEKIRRNIAAAEFILNHRKKSVKITVSTCASEKKRSDANSVEVLFRARKTLQKANEFSHNISSKA